MLNTVILYDADGFELATNEEVTIAQGKKIAAQMLADTAEYPDAYKAEIRDKNKICVWDAFRRNAP